MGSPAEGAATILQTAGVGHLTSPSSTAWVMKIGRLMEIAGHDQMVALYDTGGFNPNTKWLLDFVTVQAIIRSAPDAYGAGYAKAQQVKDALLGLEPQAVGSDWWAGVTMLSDIAFLKHDDKNRALFSINFRILQEKAPNILTHRRALDDTESDTGEWILELGAWDDSGIWQDSAVWNDGA